MADVQSILQSAAIPQAVKASAWDQYQAAANEDDLAARLNKLPIPNSVKADLWDAKRSESGGAIAAKIAKTQAGMATQAQFDKTTTEKSPADSAMDFGKGFLSQFDPRPALKSLYENSRLKKAMDAYDQGNYGEAAGHLAMATTPVGLNETVTPLVTGAVKAQLDQIRKAKDSYDKGNYSEAFVHTLAGALPLVGPAAANAGEDIARGDIAKGLGESAGILLPFGVSYAKGLIKPPVASGLNSAEQAAVELADKESIPLTAGQRAGSQILKNVEGLVQNAPGGSGYATKAKAAQVEALQDTGNKIAGEVNPQGSTAMPAPGPAVTAENAGKAVSDALEQKIADLHDEANTHYSKLRTIENDPANLKTVTTQQPTNQVTSSGQVVTVPISKDVPLPVDMRPVKTALQPIYDRLKQTMPIAQQQASVGLKALENIMDGDDHVPASIADQNLSAIKSIARTDNPNLRNISQGTAAKAVSTLENAVQQAFAKGGPDATAALQDGRAATKAKYAVADVLDGLKDEPVQTFNKLTAPKDANIKLLRSVAQHAPDVMPDVGRAYVENLLDTATAEGGFQKGGTVLNKWNALGPETRKILFKDPAVADRLDNFFLLAKRAGEVANPSKTAYVAQLVPTGVLLATNPAAGASVLLGNAAVSRLLFSSAGSKLLTKAMTVPKLNTALAASTASQLLKLVGDGAVPVQNGNTSLVPAQ